jgi:hypothetical protein
MANQLEGHKLTSRLVFVYRWSCTISVACLMVSSMCALSCAQTLSRGQEILQERGLQIQAMIVPDQFDNGLSVSRFAESNFTAVNLNSFNRNVSLNKYLGPAPGMPSGLWYNNGLPVLNVKERPYLPNLVSLQFHDELDVSQQAVLDESKTVLESWRSLYPNVIGYLNHISGNSDAQLQNYLSYSQPDMVMFATYPFNGNVAGGSPTDLYVDLQRFRKLGLAGHDGTGNHPIPYALYLQTFTWDTLNNHHPSASEMRLNQFSAWSFGYTFATAFMYTDIPNESDFQASLFVGSGDATPRQPAFDDMAETNRQSRNLGDALVRLQSTDVGMVMGQNRLQFGQFEFTVDNTLPNGVVSWTSATDDDPYLIGVSAQNIGNVNNGLRGDVVVGQFRPMQGAIDPYFMIVNGLTAPSGTVDDATQTIHLNFDFGMSGINSLLRLSRDTGTVEPVPLVHNGGSLYSLDLALDGGTGDLFKYNNGLAFVGQSQLRYGFAVSTSSNVVFIGEDGTSILSVKPDVVTDITGLANGNVVSRIGADTWRVYDAQGTSVATRQLENLGSFVGAVPVGGGGYAAVSDSHIVFIAADGNTIRNTLSDSVELVTPLTNGNVVGHLTGTESWRLYTPEGNTLATRVLDNSGLFHDAAALGAGGYAAATDSRIIFVSSNGVTVNNVVTDIVASLTSLANGNVVGQLMGTNSWRIYDSAGNILATRLLDNIGTFNQAVAVGDGGYAAVSDSGIVFVAADGQTVHQTLADVLEFVTPLSNGNVAGLIAGTDSWRLYDAEGNILATKLLASLGEFTGAAPTALFALTASTIPGDYDSDGIVDSDDYDLWKSSFGSTSELAADGNGNGLVDAADYTIWRDHIGGLSGGASGVVSVAGDSIRRSSDQVASNSVPEPNASFLFTLGIGILGLMRMRAVSLVATLSRTLTIAMQLRAVPSSPATVSAVLVTLLSCAASQADQLSRGHKILLNRGMQLHAMLVPNARTAGIGGERFAESDFSGISLNSFDRNLDLANYVGVPTVSSLSLWINEGPAVLNSSELELLPHLVALQLHDEQDITSQAVLDEARVVLTDWRDRYPDVIGYLNQNGSRHTARELADFVGLVKPDMVMFDVYPFDGQVGSRRLAEFYVALQKYRQLGIGGYDGTGRKPIPYGLYLQTFTSGELNYHMPSASEMRLNQFSAWAFGYTFATAFFYVDVPDESDLQASLFLGQGDASPRSPAFTDIAETNRQSLRLGRALVRLRSTDVRMIMGEHRGGAESTASTVINSRPTGVPVWSFGAGNDPYLKGVRARNIGSVNDGLPGDVIVGHFTPLQGATDEYFMVVNGLTAPNGTVDDCKQRIRIDFDFGDSGISRLLKLSRETDVVEKVRLVHDGEGRYHLEIDCDGGTGDLYKYENGIPFVDMRELNSQSSARD